MRVHTARPIGIAAAAILGIMASADIAAAGPSTIPLELEAKIPLGAIRGRIDHLAVDLGRRRLFVSELGNDTVGVLDVARGRAVRMLHGLREPQGVGYVQATDTLYVANAGDGSVRMFRGGDLAPAGTIALGEDADNVRVDATAHRLLVGYGSGALAVIDTTTGARLPDIALAAHPESFQLDRDGRRILVNVPDAGEIAVLDRATHRQTATWPTGALRANFPLALDESHDRALAVFRRPAKLGVFRADDGRLLASVDTCGDSDDVFIDRRRDRIYVICGQGAIDVISDRGGRYERVARIPTRPGARTGLFVPALDRLFVAARATTGTPAAILVFRPVGQGGTG